MHARVVLGVGKGVLFREVSSVQRLKCMQEWYLGWEKVSCLERCPQFRSVLSYILCIRRNAYIIYTYLYFEVITTRSAIGLLHIRDNRMRSPWGPGVHGWVEFSPEQILGIDVWICSVGIACFSASCEMCDLCALCEL